MARHLLEIQAKTRLSLGKSIAQFLSSQVEADYTVLKWLTIWKGGEEKAYTVTYHEVVNEGDVDDLDIGAFPSVDPKNLPHGVVDEFDTADEALGFAGEMYGAAAQKYVAESMLSEEYAAHLNEQNDLGL